MSDKELIIKVRDLKKVYNTGQYGYNTLTEDLQSWWAKIRGKKDPNSMIGFDTNNDNITKNKKFLALEGINLEIYKGDTIGIIGGNGAGKSTLLKLLSRITAPTEGDISYNGRISSMLEIGTGFNPEMTGRENIYMNGTILGMSKAEVDAKMDSIIEFSECEKFIDTPVKRYSSGMYVKLAFAVSANLDSEILIMDEVLAVGDMKFQKKCIAKMRELATQEGRTVLYVSHNMATIRELCNRCIVLEKGKIIYDGGIENSISLYNEEVLTSRVHYDFHSSPRRWKNYQNNILEVSFKEKDSSFFEFGEKIKLDLKWKPSIINKEYYFRVMILDVEQSNLGMSFCRIDDGLNTLEPRNKEILLDLKGIAPGKYFLTFEMSSLNDANEMFTSDWPTDLAQIEIGNCPEHENGWDTRNWGHVKLNDLQIME